MLAERACRGIGYVVVNSVFNDIYEQACVCKTSNCYKLSLLYVGVTFNTGVKRHFAKMQTHHNLAHFTVKAHIDHIADLPMPLGILLSMANSMLT